MMPPGVANKFVTAPGNDKLYLPILDVSSFWLLSNDFVIVNDTVKEVNAMTHLSLFPQENILTNLTSCTWYVFVLPLFTQVPLKLHYEPQSLMKFTLYQQFDELFEQQAGSAGDSDEMKQMFLDTNPYLLGVTVFVTLAHVVLSTLAFKNDISHWKNAENMEGVSVRSMFWKVRFMISVLEDRL